MAQVRSHIRAGKIIPTIRRKRPPSIIKPKLPKIGTVIKPKKIKAIRPLKPRTTIT